MDLLQLNKWSQNQNCWTN